jgi:hypothetical protein
VAGERRDGSWWPSGRYALFAFEGTLDLTETVTESGPGRDVGNLEYGRP